MGYIDQLIDHGVLARSPGEYPVLVLTPSSTRLLKGETQVTLREAKKVEEEAATPKRSADDAPPLSDAERVLFESLRVLRRKLADELAVPAFVVFADTTLQEFARVRPSTPAGLITSAASGSARWSSSGADPGAPEVPERRAGALHGQRRRPRARASIPASGRSAGSIQASEFFEQG